MRLRIEASSRYLIIPKTMIQKICPVSGQTFTITDEDLKFYQKMGVSAPTLCPDERFRRRMAWRHGGQLFRTQCGLTKKTILSMYSPDKGYTVYDQEAWWSDHWSPFDYGQEVDFSRPIFEQVSEIFQKVPHISLVNTNSENSYYTNHTLDHKNCYLIFGGSSNRDCMHGYFFQSCTDTVDGESLVGCELCFNGEASLNCFNCAHFSHAQNCSDCYFIEECIGCQDCIACIGLRQKKYHVLNKPYPKEEYEKLKLKLQLHRHGSLETIKQKFEDFKKDSPRPYSHQYNCEDCSGDMLFNCRNCHYAFDCKESENCKYLAFTPKGLESYDCSFTAPVGPQFSYECVSTLGKENMTDMLCWHCHETIACIECHHSQNLLGCVSIKKQKNCILNKAYTQQEYEILSKKIIQHMKETQEYGEFFPIPMSPYFYNHALAQQLYPLSQKEALDRGYPWKEEAAASKYVGDPYTIPDDINAVPDDICDKILLCEATGKHYRLPKAELDFYRKIQLPIPKVCPEERSRQRMTQRNPRTLFSRQCQQCQKQIQTSYAPDRPEKILCEDCYLKTIN